MLKKPLMLICALCIISACEKSKNADQENKAIAEQLFQSVYSGDPSRIDSLVSIDMISSYPVFEELFGTSVIRGREAYKNLAIRFGEQWTDAHVAFDEEIAEDDKVVLVWSFSAKRITSAPDSSSVAGQGYSWGGITLFRFNESGKITAEIGEESSPGPMNRLGPDDISN